VCSATPGPFGSVADGTCARCFSSCMFSSSPIDLFISDTYADLSLIQLQLIFGIEIQTQV
jgi:hypothetical protein